MGDNGDIEDEYPFSFMNTPASLQLLASSEVALMIWQHEHSNLNGNGISLCVRLFLKLKATCSCDGMLVNIPSRFKAEIDQKIVTIHQEMRNWIEFLRKYKLIDEDPRADFSTHFKHIVINTSGRIVYKATAVNILNSGDLSDDLVSYRMACRFCLEDQIKRIWPSVAEDVRLNEIAARNNEYDLEFYWTRRMKSSDDSIHDADFSVQCMLYRVLPSWPAFEYFWKLLSQEERVSGVISYLRAQDHRVTEIALPTLNRIHAEKVLKVALMNLVHFFLSSNYEYLPHLPQMYQVWTIKNTDLEEKKRYFFKILLDLWRQVFGVFTEPRPNYAQCDHINDVLLQIWSSAEDELKDYVSNKTHVWLFFDILVKFPVSDNVFYCYGHDAIFMSDLLKRSTDLDKEQLWRACWRKLALLVKPSCLERLMRLCLPNDDAIEVFKNEVADFKDLFRSLIKEGFYSHFKEYLLFICSKDAKQFHRLGKNMLESNLDVIFLHDDDKFAKFDWFIGELFSNVEKDADEFKTQIISSTESLKCLFSARHSDGTRLSDFGSITSRFVNNDEQQLNLVKSKLWAAWKMENGYVYDYQLYADQWRSFMEWCIVDREELTAFKSSLDLKRVFLVRLGQYFNIKHHYGYANRCNHTAEEVLEFLDAVLNRVAVETKRDDTIRVLEMLQKTIRVLRIAVSRSVSFGFQYN